MRQALHVNASLMHFALAVCVLLCLIVSQWFWLSFTEKVFKTIAFYFAANDCQNLTKLTVSMDEDERDQARRNATIL